MPDPTGALARPEAVHDPVALLDGVPLTAADAGHIEAARAANTLPLRLARVHRLVRRAGAASTRCQPQRLPHRAGRARRQGRHDEPAAVSDQVRAVAGRGRPASVNGGVLTQGWRCLRPRRPPPSATTPCLAGCLSASHLPQPAPSSPGPQHAHRPASGSAPSDEVL